MDLETIADAVSAFGIPGLVSLLIILLRQQKALIKDQLDFSRAETHDLKEQLENLSKCGLAMANREKERAMDQMDKVIADLLDEKAAISEEAAKRIRELLEQLRLLQSKHDATEAILQNFLGDDYRSDILKEREDERRGNASDSGPDHP